MAEETGPQGFLHDKWVQLVVGVVSMAMIANLQYGWTLFVNPINAKFSWDKAAIQVAFTIFVFVETWAVPIEAWFVDKYGPRAMVLFGGVMVAIAWVINSFAASLLVLYVGAFVGGVGAAAVYGTCVGNALKWFPGRRGLAAGVTAAGFGAGAALTVIPISNMIASAGYEQAFWFFGIGQGVVVVIMSCLMRKAPKQLAAPKKASLTGRDYRPAEVIRMPVFWVMYLMFVLVASGGLMAAAQIGPIAGDFKIDKEPVALFGLVLPALTFAISLDRIFDGFGRPFFGWVSDRIGRENTMFIAFSIAAASLYALSQYGGNPIVFVLVSALFFGVFGEIYSLFPATSGDTFGSSFAATNAGMLYTAKGTASLLVPLASALAAAKGWLVVFTIAMSFNVVAALLAMFVLKPMRARHFARSRGEAAPAAAQTA